MKDIFYELIQEARNGKVIIDGEEWPIAFNTRIIKDNELTEYNENFPVLTIKNEEQFLDLLQEYLMLELELNRKAPQFNNEKEKNHIKMILAYLFVNATTEDFINPENLIRKNISFAKDQTFSELNDGVNFFIDEHFLSSQIEVKRTKQSLLMETPYKLDISLVKHNGEQKLTYPLPSISYGIDDETCYVYSLINPKRNKELTEEEKQYEKRINRLLYKLNEGIIEAESNEYKNYKEGLSDYYPENISDVTPSFLLSTVVFLSLLQKKNIKNIKIVPYLPVRYLSRQLTIEQTEDEVLKEKLNERNNNIQNNATNKFIRTFMRAEYHMNSLTLTSYPYDNDEYLSFSLDTENNDINNQILSDVSKSIIDTELKNRRNRI